MTHKQNYLFFLFLGLILLCSCSSKKEMLYFSDVDVTTQDKIVFSPSTIRPNDILSIVISSSTPELAVMYNQNTTPATGYLVSLDGMITLPVLGKIKAQDLTLMDLENVLAKTLIDGKHLANPIVTVRLLNAKFTVLGEVNSPGTYPFSEQNISILQALGYAGDLTIHGKRQDVLIIREENNSKTYMRIDMTSKKWFDSPYYYIKPNDVIYVNPNDAKVKSAGYISSVGGLLGLISIALSTFLILTK